jgi:hypothetical protein
MAQAAKRIGRPIKEAPKGERVQLGVMVGTEFKDLIAKAAEKSGRTMSQEAENIIERALALDAALKATGQDKDALLHAALRRHGYKQHRIVHGKVWKVWVPKDFPVGSYSEWKGDKQ